MAQCGGGPGQRTVCQGVSIPVSDNDGHDSVLQITASASGRQVILENFPDTTENVSRREIGPGEKLLTVGKVMVTPT